MLGFGWEHMAHAWYCNGKPHSPEKLAAHLKKIIQEEKRHNIPDFPPVKVPKRKDLTTLGTLAPNVVMMDEDLFVAEEDMKKEAQQVQKEREDEVTEDAVEYMQPTTRPPVDNTLLGKHLEICCMYHLEDGSGESN